MALVAARGRGLGGGAFPLDKVDDVAYGLGLSIVGGLVCVLPDGEGGSLRTPVVSDEEGVFFATTGFDVRDSFTGGWRGSLQVEDEESLVEEALLVGVYGLRERGLASPSVDFLYLSGFGGLGLFCRAKVLERCPLVVLDGEVLSLVGGVGECEPEIALLWSDVRFLAGARLVFTGGGALGGSHLSRYDDGTQPSLSPSNTYHHPEEVWEIS